MNDILETIVAHKRKEVAERKSKVPLEKLKKAASYPEKCFSLAAFLKNEKRTGIITEFKRCSPSKGMINEAASVVEVTQKYNQYGASGLSVLTDTHFFKGSDEDLKIARSHNQIPILRKDFIIDTYQVIETKSLGADVILLIAECLTKEEVASLAKLAHAEGLEVLLEMHSESQLDKLSPEITLAGINNRDLRTFKVDINRSIRLAEKLPAGLLKIAESGINDPATIRQMKAAGFNGFLMGEHFMKQADPGEAFRKFVEQIKE